MAWTISADALTFHIRKSKIKLFKLKRWEFELFGQQTVKHTPLTWKLTSSKRQKYLNDEKKKRKLNATVGSATAWLLLNLISSCIKFFTCSCCAMQSDILHKIEIYRPFDSTMSYGISIQFDFTVYAIRYYHQAIEPNWIGRSAYVVGIVGFLGWCVVCASRLIIANTILEANSIVRFRISKLLANGRVTRYDCNCRREKECASAYIDSRHENKIGQRVSERN